jgi:hypothetical protein
MNIQFIKQVAVGVVFLMAACSVNAKGYSLDIQLPFSTAVIYYDISGSQTGKETLYIRDSGNERVKVSQSEGKVMFVKTSTNTIEITTRDSIIQIDMDKKSGIKTTNPQKFIQQELDKLSKNERAVVMKNLEQMGTGMATQMGGQVKKNAGKHLGYTCDLVTIMGSTSCQMSGTPILLKTTMSMAGITMNTVASKIDRNKTVPASLFEVPGGVSIQYNREADEMAREMVRSMITAMKDPGAAKKFEQGMQQGRMEMEEAQAQQAQERRQDDGVQEEERPDQEQIDEMLKKGKKAFEGFFK